MEFANYLTEQNIITALLLFIRTTALMVFFPFFNHNQIHFTIKTALALMLTIFLFPITPPVNISNLTMQYLVLEAISELFFGLCAGIMLVLVFGVISMAGEQISMNMGFSMANVMDPQSGINSPLMVNSLNIIVLMAFLLFDGHHLILYFVSKSAALLPLGEFTPGSNIASYIIKGVANMFLFGFVVAFPIVGMALLADLIFGMLMKTMPQFNLLVVGFPIKITVAFVILIFVLGSIIRLMTNLFLNTLNDMPSLFF